MSIIAGGGTMPVAVAEAARAAGRHVHIFGISGAAGPEIEKFPHSWINFGHIGKILSVARAEDCRDMVIVGGVRRPRFADLRLDLGAVLNLPFILGWVVGGDNSVLSGIIRFFESKGFRVVGAHEIAPDLIAGKGVFTRRKPGKVDRQDIQLGLDVIAALGALDVGQAAVVAHRYVLAVEAAEGTDRMLERCGQLNRWGRADRRKRAGVLVKGAKPGQERRIDLPTVGPETVRNAAAAGLAGIALAANDVLILERENFIRAADEAGLFVVGVDTDGGTGT
ncbi:MAG: UDP-2,3-diacylglucosamine diphosphatase LpxI [Methyloligellaceae bacterium]